MGATLLSKALGLIRNTLLAAHYGTTETANAFSAALRIPLSFFDILFSAAILGCFIPVYNSIKSDNSDKNSSPEQTEFASVFFCSVSLISGIASIIGMIFASPIIKTVAAGLLPETSALAASLLRILFPMVAFAAGAYTLVGVLQSRGSFIAPALISSISNGGVIIYFIFIDRGGDGIYGLAFAYMISWLLQLITLAVPLLKSGFKLKFKVDFKNPNLKKALKMAPPILIGSWLVPAGTLLGTYFSSMTETSGAVSVFDYANNIYFIAAGILTYSVCNYLFPKLSRISDTDINDFNESVQNGIRGSLFVILPVSAALLVLSGEATAVLYMRGSFTPEAAQTTAGVLAVIVLGMPAFAIIEFFSRVFFAKKQPLPAAAAALAGTCVNALSTSIFIKSNLFSGSVNAVGAGNALGQLAAATVLIVFAVIKLKGLFTLNFVVQIIKCALCSVVSFVVMYLLHSLIRANPYQSSVVMNIAVAVYIFAAGAAVFLFGAKLTRLKLK